MKKKMELKNLVIFLTKYEDILTISYGLKKFIENNKHLRVQLCEIDNSIIFNHCDKLKIL